MFGLEIPDPYSGADADRIQVYLKSSKERDAAFYRFFGKYLLHPLALVPLVAFLLSLWVPDVARTMRESLSLNVLAELASTRAAATSFKDAAFLYWLAAVPTLPFCLLYMRRLAQRLHFDAAVFALARFNVMSGIWRGKGWTLDAGRRRFATGVLAGVGLIAVLVAVNGEPSYCKGCETSSVVGFLLINWAGMHLLLFFTYWMAVFFDNWKAIRGKGGIK